MWTRQFYALRLLVFEPPHVKTNKMACAPSEDSSFLHADSEDWSDWADAQVDLSLRWAHMPCCWFCHEMALLSILQITHCIQSVLKWRALF